MSFPRAPLGSVSIQVWSSVCAAAIALVAEVVGAFIAQVVDRKEPVPVGAESKKAQ